MIDLKNVKFVEVVPDDDDDDDVVMGIEGEEEDERKEDEEGQVQQEQESTKVSSAVGGFLSKSWTVGSAHVPTFTGGKVTHSQSQSQSSPFLLLPVHGDLAIVDSLKGVKLGTVRRGCGNGNNNNDDENRNYTVTDSDGDVDLIDEEEDGVDQEGITSYALAHTNHSIVTCSRNNMLQQYSISQHHRIDDGETNPDEATNPTTIQKGTTTTLKVQVVHTWGRSGHTLPVTVMSYHDSDIFVATGSVDSTVRIWDVRGRFVTHVFRPIRNTGNGSSASSGRIGGISSLQWKPGTEQLIIAIGRDDGSIAIHNLRDPLEEQLNRVILLQDHLSAVTCMDWWSHPSPPSPSSTTTTTMNNNNEDEKNTSEFFITTGRDSILNLWRMVVVDDNDDENDTNNKKKRKQKKEKQQKQQDQQE